jgi:GNAT superfamily N-acetyltransferase
MRPRAATMTDVPAVRELIGQSVRGLSAGHYSAAQIEAAMTHVFGVDTQLIADGTYYVIDGPAGPVASGGWSARRTLFGGDQMKGAEDPMLNPGVDLARIRAFFVHPDWARRGLARQLYEACERAATAAGFDGFELMATLPGVPLYHALGFMGAEDVALPLSDGVTLPLRRMTRRITVGG